MLQDVREYILNKALLSIQSLNSTFSDATVADLFQKFTAEYRTIQDTNQLIEKFPLDLYKDYYQFAQVLRGNLSLKDWVNLGDEGEESFLKLKRLKEFSQSAKENLALLNQIDSSLSIEDDFGDEDGVADSQDTTDDIDTDEIDDNIFNFKKLQMQYAENQKSSEDAAEAKPEDKSESETNTDEVESISRNEDTKKGDDLKDTESENGFAPNDGIKPDNTPTGFEIIDTRLTDSDINTMQDEQVLMLLQEGKIKIPENLNKLAEKYKSLLLKNRLITQEQIDESSEEIVDFSLFDDLIGLVAQSTEGNQSAAKKEVEKNEVVTVENYEKNDKLYVDDTLNKAANLFMNKFDKLGLLNIIPDALIIQDEDDEETS